jgi:hypothetical protein
VGDKIQLFLNFRNVTFTPHGKKPIRLREVTRILIYPRGGKVACKIEAGSLDQFLVGTPRGVMGTLKFTVLDALTNKEAFDVALGPIERTGLGLATAHNEFVDCHAVFERPETRLYIRTRPGLIRDHVREAS